MLPRRRADERCGRANFRSDAEKDFFHADTDAASEKGNYDRDEKEIADANAITEFIALSFAKKEEGFADDRGVAIAKSEEEKSFAIANGTSVVSSKEKDFANAS